MKFIIISLLIVSTCSYAINIESKNNCLRGYYVKFNKYNDKYVASNISSNYIDEENVLYASFDERGKFDGLQIPKLQQQISRGCIYLRSNTGNKAHCGGDFVISKINKGDGVALPALTIMTAGTVPAFQFLSGDVSYSSNRNESNIELANKAFNYEKYDAILDNVKSCEINFQEKIELSHQKYRTESGYEKDFIKHIKQGTETNCGIVQYLVGSNARLDIGKDTVWVKPDELLPKYNLDGEIIPCTLYKNIYGSYGFK